MQLDDIKKLAIMARVDMEVDELAKMANDFDPILAYVSQVQEVKQSGAMPNYTLDNVMRDDIVTNPKGIYTDKIVEQMPDSQDGFLKVKQIL